MSKITSLKGIEILDSRGTPTLEVILTLSNGETVNAKVPSGASTGINEALELRDQDPNRFFGKGVLKAIAHVEGPLFTLLQNKSIDSQRALDEAMIALDGTPNKSNLGANAILGVSLAIARARAKILKKPLYTTITEEPSFRLPCPMMNLLNGGAHADSSLDIQEFMICPHGFERFSLALRAGAEVFYHLKKILKKLGLSTGVGDEGGFAPQIESDEKALEILLEAIKAAGYDEKKIGIALDCAASEFYESDSKRYIEKKKKIKKLPFASRTTSEEISYLMQLKKGAPILSIEDPLSEEDWSGWSEITSKMKDTMIVGDDLYVTQLKYLQRGIAEKSSNAILIKLNQVGTLSETLDAIALAKKNQFKTIISHRSGETEDTFIADLAVATHSPWIKTGSLCRSERTSKYNRLLEIERELGSKATFAGF